jgi:PleD family two-component response regulator
MSVLSQSLPTRILIVEDNELALATMRDRLEMAGFDVTSALNGEQALAILQAQWFPVVVSGCKMAPVDGMELVERLRARGITDTYLIMLTPAAGSFNYERGNAAGVDDYLADQASDVEFLARIEAGFQMLALRRSLKEAQHALHARDPSDPAALAYSSQQLLAKLRAEVVRAQRYGRALSVLVVQVDDINSGAAIDTAMQNTLLTGLQNVIRLYVDWVAKIDAAEGELAFAVILPEAGAVEATTVKERIRTALQPLTMGNFRVTFGLACLERDAPAGREVQPADLLSVAQQCRRCGACSGATRLKAIQGSVAGGVAIACRQGYALASHCRFNQDVVFKQATSLAS